MSAIRYVGPSPSSVSSMGVASQGYTSRRVETVALFPEDVRGIISDLVDQKYATWSEVSSFFSDKPRRADLPALISQNLVRQGAKGGFEGVATQGGGVIEPIQLPPVNVYSEVKSVWQVNEWTDRTTSVAEAATENVICELEVDAPGYAWYPMIFGNILTKTVTGETNPTVTVLDQNGVVHATGQGSVRRDVTAPANVSPAGQHKLFSPNEGTTFYCFVHLRPGTTGTIEVKGTAHNLTCVALPVG